MKAAVTGAGGFIGSRLTAELLRHGWEVAALDLPVALTRVPEGARRIGVDVRDQAALREAVRGARVLFHTAAVFDLTASWPDLFATNVEAALNVCSAAQKGGVERIVFWSSGSVYGGTKRPVPLTETTPIPLDRLNLYARSKYLGERGALEAARSGGRAAVVAAKKINLGLQGGGAHGAFTWGVLDHLLADPRIDIEGISGTSAGAMNAVAGPGTAQHSYIHVEDVARAAIHLAERGQPGGVYNLAGRTPVSTADVYALARKRLGWFSLRDKRITLPDRPRLWGRPLFHVPGVALRLYGHWEVLRVRRRWMVEKFGPYPLAAPAAVEFLMRSLVLDPTRLFATGFQPAWPDATAGILKTLDEYERSGWAPFRSGQDGGTPSGAVPAPSLP